MNKHITSLQHPFVKRWVKLRIDRDFRAEERCVLVDGIKMVHEVCPHVKTIVLIATQEKLLPVNAESYDVVIVSQEVMNKISGAKSPEGLMAEVEMPPMQSLDGKKRIVALDGISDPGNMGTIFRTALALGWEGIYLLEGCCDPFNDKALRAAKGATFRLPFSMGSWKELREMLPLDQWQLLGADLEGKAPEGITSAQKRLLVLGNESHGLSAEAKASCTAVSIPMSGSMESLNVSVAAGILLYLLNPKMAGSADE